MKLLTGELAVLRQFTYPRRLISGTPRGLVANVLALPANPITLPDDDMAEFTKQLPGYRLLLPEDQESHGTYAPLFDILRFVVSDPDGSVYHLDGGNIYVAYSRVMVRAAVSFRAHQRQLPAFLANTQRPPDQDHDRAMYDLYHRSQEPYEGDRDRLYTDRQSPLDYPDPEGGTPPERIAWQTEAFWHV